MVPTLNNVTNFFNHNTSGEFKSSRWIKQRELFRFFYLPVSLLGLRHHWKLGFKPLHASVLALWTNSGPKFTSQYLANVSRALVCWFGNEVYIQDKTWISLTRNGLPKIIPYYLRKLILKSKMGSDEGKLILRATLTVIGVFRVIGFFPTEKLETITNPFTGVSQVLPDSDLDPVISRMRPITLIGKPDFSRINESSGPNYPRSTWASAADAIALMHHPKQMFAFLRWCNRNNWSLPIVWFLWLLVVSFPGLILANLFGRQDLYPTSIGKLGRVLEARGKVRIVAMVDYWTQLVLKPLHDAIFATLKHIKQDGTFNQERPLNDLMDRVAISGVKMASFDLSAATDRLPAALQVQILNKFGISGDLWITLLDRPYLRIIKEDGVVIRTDSYRYAVGQPMGAYSSWAMLALTHHIIVQVAAHRSGVIPRSEWFRDYALLGDDIVIANDLVASNYKAIMTDLGVEINMTKSHVGDCCEFAKRWIHSSLGEISPIGAGNILVTSRNFRLVPSLIMDCYHKGFPHVWNLVDRALSVWQSFDRKVNDLTKMAMLLLCLGPSGLLAKANQSPVERLGRWSSLFGGTAQPSDVFSAMTRAVTALVLEEHSRSIEQHRRAHEYFMRTWSRLPLNGFVMSFNWWVRISPLFVLKHRINQGRFPWPVQINFERLFWAVPLRLSPGYVAYVQKEIPDRDPRTGYAIPTPEKAGIIRKTREMNPNVLDDRYFLLWEMILEDSPLGSISTIDWSSDRPLHDYVSNMTRLRAKVMKELEIDAEKSRRYKPFRPKSLIIHPTCSSQG